MALIPGFEHDIFISYARINNIADGWVTRFVKELQVLLEQTAGKMGIINIWFDDSNIDPATIFEEKIARGIKGSAILVCLNSVGYGESEYCKMELETFYAKTGDEPVGRIVNSRSRIVNVLINNLQHNSWWWQFAGVPGFPFHDAKEKHEFGDPIEIGSADFRRELKKLRDALFAIMTDMKAAKATRLPVAVPPLRDSGSSEFAIYVSEVADSLRAIRKKAVSELEKKGFKVVLGIPPPDEHAAHERAAIDAVEKTQVSVHLLDQLPGRDIPGARDLCYPQRQAELALANNKPQMIWIPAETNYDEIEETGYRIFLQEVENRRVATKNYDFVKGARSTLTKDVIDFVERLQEQQNRKNHAPGSKSVLLDTHVKDQLLTMDLGKALLDNGIQPYINPQEGNPRSNLLLLEERLKQVRSLVFVWGEVSLEWLLERISMALQLIVVKRYNIGCIFVYIAPPCKNIADITMSQQFLKIKVIDGSKGRGLDTTAFQQLLIGLKNCGV